MREVKKIVGEGKHLKIVETTDGWELAQRTCGSNPVSIIPYDTKSGKVVIIREWRSGIGKYNYSLPCGMVDEGEDKQEAAVREMYEESGYVPHPDAEIVEYHQFYKSAGLTDERETIFHVNRLLKDPEAVIGVDGEEITVLVLDSKDIIHSILLDAEEKGVVPEIAPNIFVASYWITSLKVSYINEIATHLEKELNPNGEIESLVKAEPSNPEEGN